MVVLYAVSRTPGARANDVVRIDLLCHIMYKEVSDYRLLTAVG